MARFQIENRISGVILGIYEGRDEDDAVEAMARDAGYASQRECATLSAMDGDDEDQMVAAARADLIVTEVE